MTKSKKKKPEKGDDRIIDLGLFDRPMANGAAPEAFTVYDYLTFKNIVIGIGLVTFLIFVARAVSVQMAVLSAALIGIFILLLTEMASRRRWEQSVLIQFQKMNADDERLARDMARNRSEIGSLRRRLADAAGEVMRSYDKKSPDGGAAVEQRMIKSLAQQIAKLSDEPMEELLPSDIPDDLDPAIFEQHVEPENIDNTDIGHKLTDEQILQLVNASVKKDRIDLFLQPIVNLPQRKLRFYETLARIRIMPDVYLPATRYITLAKEGDVTPLIDNLLLLRGLQAIRNMAAGDYNFAFFFNITSPTLHDPKFMGDLVEFISQNRTMAPQLIFELGQKDLASMSEETLATVRGLAKLGCRFSMDQVRTLSFNHDELEDRHIRFVKLDASLLLTELDKPGGLLRLKRMKADMDRHGIDMIVEKIETERHLLEILDIDVDYGQGYLFGKPELYEKNLNAAIT